MDVKKPEGKRNTAEAKGEKTSKEGPFNTEPDTKDNKAYGNVGRNTPNLIAASDD